MLNNAQIARTWLTGLLFALLAVFLLNASSASAHGYHRYSYHRHSIVFRDDRHVAFYRRANYRILRFARYSDRRIHEFVDNGISNAGQLLFASWYGGGEKLAAHTANGERFNPNGLTVAHRSLPMGTRLQITHNGHSAVCRVNDRGPAAWTGRSIDLSRGCARAVGLAGLGHVRVARL